MSTRRPAVKLALSALSVVLAGCASTAPPLPADTLSVASVKRPAPSDFATADLDLTCEGIAEAWVRNHSQMSAKKRTVESDHESNVVAVFFSNWMPLTLLAVDTDQTDRDSVADLYARNDTLIKLAAFKHCSPKT